MNGNFNTMIELLKRYNRGEVRLSDKQAQALAELAFASKMNFKTKSKPIRKGLFDLVDTAAFGLVPNSWRPHSIGQELHGESGIDRIAGGLGTIAGIPLGMAGVLKGVASAPKAVSALGAGAKTAYGASKPLMQSAGQGAKSVYQSASKGAKQAYETAKPYMSRGRVRAGEMYQSAKPWVSKTAKNTGDRIKSTIASIKENENVRRASNNIRDIYSRNTTATETGNAFNIARSRFGGTRSNPKVKATPWE
jgi:hypothetical protein